MAKINIDKIMSEEWVNGKWAGFDEALLLFETITKDTDLPYHPDAKKFYWAMRKRKEELSDEMKEKRKENKDD